MIFFVIGKDHLVCYHIMTASWCLSLVKLAKGAAREQKGGAWVEMNTVVCSVCAGSHSACLCVYLRGCSEVTTLTDTQVWLLLMSSAASSKLRHNTWPLEGRKVEGGEPRQIYDVGNYKHELCNCDCHEIYMKAVYIIHQHYWVKTNTWI